MTKPRILLFSPFCYPPAGAEAIVTAKLLIAGLNAGWEIDAIGHLGAGHFYPSEEGKLLSKVAENIININTRIVGFNKFGNGLCKKISRKIETILWVAKAVRLGNILLTRKKYDFIISRVAPQYGHLPALILSRKRDLPWIANWSDPMPPCKAPEPYGAGFSAKIPFFLQWYYKEVAKRASWHVFPSERLREYVCQYLPECKPKSSAIPHVALGGYERKSFQKQNSFTLCHIGGLGLRHPGTFLEGVKLFLEREKVTAPFYVKFIGSGDNTAEKVAISLGIESVVISEEAKSYEETLRIAQANTVLVIIEAPCKEGIFFPSKFVDYVQTGRPILAVSPINGTLKDILVGHGGGIAVDCHSPESVAVAIQKLYIEWKAGNLDQCFGSTRLLALFGEESVIRGYSEIFSRFL